VAFVAAEPGGQGGDLAQFDAAADLDASRPKAFPKILAKSTI
jgi:hypothetical protein